MIYLLTIWLGGYLLWLGESISRVLLTLPRPKEIDKKSVIKDLLAGWVWPILVGVDLIQAVKIYNDRRKWRKASRD